MKLSQSSELGIHAIWWLATRKTTEPVGASEVAAALSASATYMVKVLHRLVDAHLLKAKKGKHGGYLMVRPPSAITLADIVEACEAQEPMYGCAREERMCSGDRRMCPICASVERARSVLFEELRKTTVADLVQFGWPSGPRVMSKDLEEGQLPCN